MAIDSSTARFRHWAKKLGKWSARGLLLYAMVLLVGLIPINNSYSPVAGGVEIFVSSTAVHADLVLPVSHGGVDWREIFAKATFRGDVQSFSHVAIGWGDRGFFLETRRWEDFRLSTAANAILLPSTSCVHVSFTEPSGTVIARRQQSLTRTIGS